MHHRFSNSVRESGLGTALFRAGNRMAGNEVRMRRDMRRHLPDHRGFGRSDIGYNRTRLEVPCRFPCATASDAPTGTDTITRSALRTASAFDEK
jgi:hypothetical protein